MQACSCQIAHRWKVWPPHDAGSGRRNHAARRQPGLLQRPSAPGCAGEGSCHAGHTLWWTSRVRAGSRCLTKRLYADRGLPCDSAGTRISRLEEALPGIKGCFTQEVVHFSGKHDPVADLKGLARPIQQPHPPIFIGGSGKRLLPSRRAMPTASFLHAETPRGVNQQMRPWRKKEDGYKRQRGSVLPGYEPER